MTRSIGEERRDLAGKRIQKKLEVLQAWESSQIPEGATLPTNHKEFRKWEDLELGVEAWTSPNLMNQPFRVEQKAEAERLFAVLNAKRDTLTKKGESRKTRVERQAERIVELEGQLRNMASQYTVARAMVERLERDLEIQLARVTDLLTGKAELLRQLADRTSLMRMESSD